MAKKRIDEVEFLAIWLHGAAAEAGHLQLVRGLIQTAMKQAIEMYGLPELDEPDDPQDIPTVIGKFAAAWDDFDRQVRQDGGIEQPNSRSAGDDRKPSTRLPGQATSESKNKTRYGSGEGTGAASIDIVVMDMPLGREFTEAEVVDEVRRRKLQERKAVDKHLYALRNRGFIRRSDNGWVRIS